MNQEERAFTWESILTSSLFFWEYTVLSWHSQLYQGIQSFILAFKVLSWHSKFYLSHLVRTNPLLQSNSSIDVDFFPSFDCTITYFAFSPSVFFSGKCCNESWIDLKVLTLLTQQVFSLMGKRQVLLVSRPQQFIDFSILPFLLWRNKMAGDFSYHALDHFLDFV